MSFKEFLDHLKAEGQVIKNAPISFFSFVVIASVMVFIGVDWHYSGTISENEATIRTLTTERDDAIQKLQETQNSHTNYFISSQLNAQTNTTLPPSVQNSSKPNFDVYLNHEYITNGILLKLGQNRELFFEVYNVGEKIATNFTFIFFSPFAQTNFIFDAHWGVLPITQPIPIGHKMYDMSDSFSLEIIAQYPIRLGQPPANGFDLTTFSLASTLRPVADPIKQFEKFGVSPNLNLSKESVASSLPIKIVFWSVDSETNEYFIFLKP